VVRPKLSEEFGYKNRMQVPVLDKVVINMGIGEGVNDRKKVDQAAADLGLIAGQKAVVTKARKSIATFKVRDGQAIGCKVTLRKTRMYEFIDRSSISGCPGARFPRPQPQELRRRRQLHDRYQRAHRLSRDRLRQASDIWGMDITVCTTAKTDAEARALLTAFKLSLPAVRL